MPWWLRGSIMAIAVALLVVGLVVYRGGVAAERVQGAAIAKSNAQLVLEASIIALKARVAGEQVFPESFDPPEISLVGELPWMVGGVSYMRLSPTQATLRAEGLGPGGASYVAEAALALAPTARTALGSGLVAQGVIAIDNWQHTRIVDAQLHGDMGYALERPELARLQRCLLRSASGSCSASRPIELADELPFSAAAGLSSYTCRPDDPRFCREGVPVRLTEPAPLTPFSALALLEAQRAGLSCDLTLGGAPAMASAADVTWAGFIAGRTVCVSSGSLIFPAGTVLSNLQIISRGGDISVVGPATLTNVTLIAEGGRVWLDGVTVNSGFIYSQHDLRIPDSVTLAGRTVVVSAGDITFAGVAQASGSGSQAQVGVYVYADGALTYASRTPTFARFFAGRTATINSPSCIVGSVEARGDINAHQGVCIDAGLLPARAQSYSVRVLSRR